MGRVRKVKPKLTGTAGSAVKVRSGRKKATQAFRSEGKFFSITTNVTKDGEKSNSNDDAEEDNCLTIKTDENQDEGTVNDAAGNDGSGDDGAESDDIENNGSNDDDDANEGDSEEAGGDNNDGAENDDGIGSDDNQGSEDSDDEEETSTGSNQKKIKNVGKIAALSKKQETPIQKFQGTEEASVSNKQLEDVKSPIKRKSTDKDEPEPENEIIPAKKPHVVDEKTVCLAEKRKEERDARSLFLKNLPRKTTAEMVKKLSPDIINVRIPLESGRNIHSLYAFLEFENEETAKRNYRMLLDKRINNKKFTVDYCGGKSKYKKAKMEHPINGRKLFISNVPAEVTVDDLKQYMPDAKTFSSRMRGTKRFVFATFEDDEKAKKAFDETAQLIINGKKLTVLFAYKKKRKPPQVAAPHHKNEPQIVSSLFEDEDDTDK